MSANRGRNLVWWRNDPESPNRVLKRLVSVETELEGLRQRFANLSDEVLDRMERSETKRARAETAARKRDGGNGDPVPTMTEGAYRMHLEAGGQVLPEVERKLGL